MTSQSRATRRRWCGLAAAVTGCCFAALFPSCETTLTTINPCGSIFGFCNPQDIDRLFADVPDFDLDPTCTIPYFGLDNPGQAGGCSNQPIFPFTPGSRP